MLNTWYLPLYQGNHCFVEFLSFLCLFQYVAYLQCKGNFCSIDFWVGGGLFVEKTNSMSEVIYISCWVMLSCSVINISHGLPYLLCRLDKRASIIDLRVECQDLEKFSVINRFAKFHGRGQVDGAESSSSSDVYANSPKSCLQRYVTALPMPRNLPDRVQCLSLWS